MASTTLPPAYDFNSFEEKRYRWWEEKGFFSPTVPDSRPSYSIVIPPPNITGSLHMGHALNNTLQDVLIRYHRLRGYNTLWMPGTDHAGIATQTVVERNLTSEGVDRFSVGREKFIEKVWEWREKYGNRIILQLKRLGASCDWSRTRFTLDEGLSKAVIEVFVTLWNEGLIYRGDYIINWCPRCRTALSDLEVDHKEDEAHLYYVRYPGADGSEGIVVATTRPETIPGDTAVAVHPDDPRFSGGGETRVIVPTANREVPVIGDEAVDPEFGTGALKITPAHAPDDFEIGRRHNLEAIKVIDETGQMNEAAGPYNGLDRTECRRAILEDLEKNGLLVKVEDYRHAVGHCYRCHTMVEPLLSKQWFVRMKDLAEPAIEAVRQGRTKIIPPPWEKTYFEWMENIRDWCISRQIWWGHRIPAWYCADCEEVVVAREAPQKCPKCGSTDISQDEDVLDTWFSSALWPFSTLGWPEKTPELEAFYPTSVLVTAFDILFFWVARMIMMGLRFMGDIPFSYVYIHALVRDEHGQKMSKTKGNVIDPLEVIDHWGADAFRFTLTALAAQGRDISLSTERIAGYGRFVNKIWNASRFALMNLEGFEPSKELRPTEWYQRWILSLLARTVTEVDQYLGEYRFDMAAKTLHSFFWHRFCDWFVELAKPDLSGRNGEDARAAAQRVLHRILTDSLLLLHPIIPFVTEELWQHLPGTSGSIMEASWPVVEKSWIDAEEEAVAENLMAIVTAVRTLRAEMDIPSSARVKVVVKTGEKRWASLLEDRGSVLDLLAGVEDLQWGAEIIEPPTSVTAVLEGAEVFLPLGEVIDLQKERERLSRGLERLEKDLAKFDKKLSNPDFLGKAPPEVVEKVKSEREGVSDQVERVRSHLRRLKG